MTSTRIALTADQALSHASNLFQASGEMPDSQWVTGSQVGAPEDSKIQAESDFAKWLRGRARHLGKSADDLTKAVNQNAEALRQAAQDLLERDAVSADVANSFTTALDYSNAAAAAAVAQAAKAKGSAPVPVNVPPTTASAPTSTSTPTPTPSANERATAGRL